MTTSQRERPLIIHHGHCIDGFTAAWVVRCYLLREFGIEPELFAANYQEPPPDVRGRDVVIVDFSYPRQTLLELFDAANTLWVYDHHQTAEADLCGLPFVFFDQGRSGAGLAWDSFFPGEPRPWLVDYVEDRDLWRWALPCSREVSAFLATLDFDLATWDRVKSWSSPGKAISKGSAILRHQARVVRQHVERAHFVAFPLAPDSRVSLVVPVVNATTCMSEIGNSLAEAHPFAVTWFAEGGRVQYSLRSSAENPDAIDVSEVARAFGGGGHRHAAGFRTTRFVHHVGHERGAHEVAR